MNIIHSRKVQPAEASAKIAALLETIVEGQLREWVECISRPRHFGAEPEQNRATAKWIHGLFDSMGFRAERQGKFSNVAAFPNASFEEAILVGAHYDWVPMCPGADDNGSAVAAMLGCAAACSLWRPSLPVIFVAFNCEEDGLKGSQDFRDNYHRDTDTPDTLKSWRLFPLGGGIFSTKVKSVGSTSESGSGE